MAETEFSLLRPIPALIKLAFFVFFSLVLLAVAGRERMTDQGWLLTLMYPLQNMVRVPQTAWQNLGPALRSREALQVENQQQQKLLTRLRGQTLHLYNTEQENKRLRALLGAVPETAVQVGMAHVIGLALDSVGHVLTVDRGSRDQVALGQAVISSTGVVGQVFRVSTLSSQITLLTDPDHSIPAQVQRTRQHVLVNGIGDPTMLEIPFLPHNADIRKGDILLTSGLGGRFPRGLPVGRIAAVDRQSSRDFSKIRVRSWVQVDRLDAVLLVWPGAASAVAPVPAPTAAAKS